MGKAKADNASVGIEDWKRMVRVVMADLFEEHAKLTAKYVHACANGHEAISSPPESDWGHRITSTPITGTTPFFCRSG